MRIQFDLEQFEKFTFTVNGEKYSISTLEPLAEKSRLKTNIHEYVYKLPTEKYVYLTVVGDENETSALGIYRGWYVAEILTEEDAQLMIKAIENFKAVFI